jgi:hypothetical protein
MATSRNTLCGICEAQHITKYADQWCPECDEGLCSDCENHFLIISRIDKSPTQSLWCVEIQSGQQGLSWC